MDKIKLPIIYVHDVTDHILASSKCMEQFQEETSKDGMLEKLKDAVFNGWLQRNNIWNLSYSCTRVTEIRYPWNMENFSKVPGLLFQSLCILRCWKSSNTVTRIKRIKKCLLQAKETLSWPGISK